VENLGRESSNGHRNLSDTGSDGPDAVKFYVNEVRAGYRAEYLKELADRVASGELDVESWLKSPLPTLELMKEMRGVKGVGPYAAENVLKLLAATTDSRSIRGRAQSSFPYEIMDARPPTRRSRATTHASNIGAVWRYGVT